MPYVVAALLALALALLTGIPHRVYCEDAADPETACRVEAHD